MNLLFIPKAQPGVTLIAGPLKVKPSDWVAACGGTEVPFETRTGRTLHYMWDRVSGEHAYYDVHADIFLSNEETTTALGMN